MEASERGELSSSETDDRLREVVESSVLGQVKAGREISQVMDGTHVGGVRPRGDDENGDTSHDPSPDKRRRELPGR